jgi:hypothetical protein
VKPATSAFVASTITLRVTVSASCFRDFVAKPFPLLPRDLQNAVEVATEIPPQVPLRIAPQIGLRVAMRTGRKVGLATAARTQPQITCQNGPAIAVQVGRRIAEKTPPLTPARAPPEITPGTVPGTVPPPVRGASIPACFTKAISLTCYATKRYAKTPK